MLKIILFLFLATVGWRDCAWSQAKTGSGQRVQLVYAQEFNPPSEYREWYHEAERCVGKTGNYRKITWTMTAEPWNFDSLGHPKTFGLFAPSADGRHGVILLNVGDSRNKWYVMHEEIHDILWRNGWVGPDNDSTVDDSVNIRRQHPLPYYEKCTKTYIEELRKLWAQTQNPWKQVYQP